MSDQRPSAKAAQQIISEAQLKDMNPHKWEVSGIDDMRLTEIIQAAIDEAVRPYEELLDAAENVLAIHAGRGERVPASIKQLRQAVAALSPPKGGEKT